MKREKHPTWEEIVEHAHGLERKGSALSSHIEICPRCLRLAKEARETLRLFDQARIPPAPAEAVDQALRLIRREIRKRRTIGLGGKLREAWATLVSDSLQPSPALRGSIETGPRMLLYETEAYSIVISLTPSQRKTFDLVGQVAPRRGTTLPEGGKAELLRAERRREADLTDFGQFIFAEEPSASGDLSIRLADELIRLSLP